MTPQTKTSVAEARVWRLAFLLTSDPDAAARLAARLPRLQPDFATLEPARLDRLVIQTARTMPRPAHTADRTPRHISTLQHALASLPPQQREAWVLSRVDTVDDLWMSRAMDCSKTAARSHLAAADAALHATLGDDLPTALDALRAQADAVDPAPLIVEARAELRRSHRRRLAIAGLIAFLALSAAVIAALRLAP